MTESPELKSLMARVEEEYTIDTHPGGTKKRSLLQIINVAKKAGILKKYTIVGVGVPKNGEFFLGAAMGDYVIGNLEPNAPRILVKLKAGKSKPRFW